MKSLKSLSIVCVALLTSPIFLHADPITGMSSASKTGTQVNSAATPNNTFRFDSPSTSTSLFPVASNTKENQLLAVALDQTPPAISGSTSSVASVNGTPRLTPAASTENPLSASAIPAAASGAPAFRLDNSQATSPVTVEPTSSLVLLGTGLICAAAVVLRRRRTV